MGLFRDNGKIETTIGIIGYILGLYRNNGKDNGNNEGLGFRVDGRQRVSLPFDYEFR